jgi:hypothetical protein
MCYNCQPNGNCRCDLCECSRDTNSPKHCYKSGCNHDPIYTTPQRRNNPFGEDLHISYQGAAAAIAGNRLENSSDRLDPPTEKTPREVICGASLPSPA